jgi:quercetin dioxygenase-like cupin family protein
MSDKPRPLALFGADAWCAAHRLSRRTFFGLGALSLTGALLQTDNASADQAADGYSKLNEAEIAKAYPHVHEGEGTISVRYFGFDKAPAPANFVIYDMPPGSSEGVHTHHLGDTVLGPYDEYYYVIHGEGEMEIDGKVIPIRTGDHVHTPLGVAHGVRNVMRDENLRIFLTFISRTSV